MTVLDMLAEAQASHVEAHGRFCGVLRGARPQESVCVALRRSWAIAFPKDAKREEHALYRMRHPEAKRRSYLKHRDANPQYYSEWRDKHRDQRRARDRMYYATHREAILAADSGRPR